MIKLTIEINELKGLLACSKTRNAAIKICEVMKLSKYSYTGAEAKTGIFYYVELPEKVVKRLYELIIDDNDVVTTTQLMLQLSTPFVIQLIKKLGKAGEE